MHNLHTCFASLPVVMPRQKHYVIVASSVSLEIGSSDPASPRREASLLNCPECTSFRAFFTDSPLVPLTIFGMKISNLSQAVASRMPATFHHNSINARVRIALLSFQHFGISFDSRLNFSLNSFLSNFKMLKTPSRVSLIDRVFRLPTNSTCRKVAGRVRP